MIQRFLCGWLLLASFTSTAGAAASPPCQPSASCALRMAREAAQQQVLGTTNDKDRIRALYVVLWAAQEDRAASPESWRASMVAMRQRVDKLPAGASKSAALAPLARAMAATGLVPEARLLSNALASQQDRDAVNAEVATFYASRGRPREAFEALETIPAGSLTRGLARSRLLTALVGTGDVAIVRAAEPHLEVDEPDLVASLIPLTLQAAGKHQAARAEAMKIKDGFHRISTLTALQLNNEQKGYDEEIVPSVELILRELDGFKGTDEQAGLLRQVRAEMKIALREARESASERSAAAAAPSAALRPDERARRVAAIRESMAAEGVIERHPDAVALQLVKEQLVDEADIELRRLLARGVKDRSIATTCRLVLLARVRENDLARALDLATHCTQVSQNRWDPYTDIYKNLVRSAGLMPGADDFSPEIRADPDLFGGEEDRTR